MRQNQNSFNKSKNFMTKGYYAQTKSSNYNKNYYCKKYNLKAYDNENVDPSPNSNFNFRLQSNENEKNIGAGNSKNKNKSKKYFGGKSKTYNKKYNHSQANIKFIDNKVLDDFNENDVEDDFDFIGESKIDENVTSISKLNSIDKINSMNLNNLIFSSNSLLSQGKKLEILFEDIYHSQFEEVIFDKTDFTEVT